MPYKIVIDNRERVIIDILKKYDKFIDVNGGVITWEATTLNTGDYIIFKDAVALCIIERKTWADLAASILDGRHQNIEKLKKYRIATGAIICYLIEGTPIPADNAIFCKIPYKALLAHLDHLMIRDAVHILYAKNIMGTINRLFSLIRNISSIRDKKIGAGIGISGEDNKGSDDASGTNSGGGDNINTDKVPHIDLAKIKFEITDEQVIQNMFMSIKGINMTTYKLFHNIHIYDLLTGTIDEVHLSNLSYTNGKKLGIVKSRKIFASVRDKSIHIKILASIPGISKNKAVFILNNFNMEYLLNNWQSVGPVIENLKHGSKKIGQVAVYNIKKFLIK